MGGEGLNYLMQIRAFDDYRLYNQKLSAGQVSLWYTLMSINNKAGWSTWFTAANATLESLSGLSRSGIVKNRNVLKQLNLIDFSSNGKKATSYRVCVLYTSDSAQRSVQDRTHRSAQESVQDRTQQSSALIKQNETKLNETNDEDDEVNLSDHARAIALWESLWSKKPNSVVVNVIDSWLELYGFNIYRLGIEIAGRNEIPNQGAVAYLDKVFKDWESRNVRTLNDVWQAVKDHNVSVDNQSARPEGEIPDIPIFKLTD